MRLRVSVRVRLALAVALGAAMIASMLIVVMPSASAATGVTVFYRPAATWSVTNIHYAATGGLWTAVPGVAMVDAACAGWKSTTIDLGGANGLQAVFNNGSGTWDNNGGANYQLGTGDVIVFNGAVSAGNPCAVTPGNTSTVFYRLPPGWSSANLHYQPINGPWTAVPGVPMDPACAGWVRKGVDVGGATGLVAVFNNGSGTWDNNNGNNYFLGLGNAPADRRLRQANRVRGAAEAAMPDHGEEDPQLAQCVIHASMR